MLAQNYNTGTMPFFRISPEQMEAICLEWGGIEPCMQQVRQRTNKERFADLYGTSAGIMATLFQEFQTTDIQEAFIQRPDPFKLCMTLYWMKNKASEKNLVSKFNCSDDTCREIIWEYAKKIQALKGSKIKMDETINDDVVFVLTVDGVHFRTRECRKAPNSNWYSHKFKGPGLSYELGIAIHKNQLCWINGPFRASTHDITMFNSRQGEVVDPVTKFTSEDGLATHIPEGKKAIGDRGGYRGNREKVSVKDRLDSDEVYKFKNTALARHETFNGRIKKWRILSERWIHSLDKHRIVLEAICVLEQYALENGNPMFEV